MKSKTPFLDFYRTRIQTGKIGNGLCHSIGHDLTQTLDIFQPDADEVIDLLADGYCSAYWGSGLPEGAIGEAWKFTPLRQTIILLCAAINNEL